MSNAYFLSEQSAAATVFLPEYTFPVLGMTSSLDVLRVYAGARQNDRWWW